MHLTPRQEEILTLLREHAEHSDQAPTIAQLCEMSGVRSRGSMHKHIKALIAAGRIEPIQGRHRGIRLLPEPVPEDQLPLLGRIAAGRPIEAVTEETFVQVPEQLRTRQPCYVLEVVGDSMRDAGILDGDQVVVEQRDQAANGAIVVALIRDSEVTLKRLSQSPGQITLKAENPDIPPMHFRPDEVAIQGVVVGQMRRYR